MRNDDYYRDFDEAMENILAIDDDENPSIADDEEDHICNAFDYHLDY